MNYISTKEAAKKWGLTERSVRGLCQNGRVPNVKRSGRSWLIPDTQEKPLIGLKRASNEKRERFDLFLNPTFCENNKLSFVTPEEIEICTATDDIMKGNFEEAEQLLRSFIKNCSKENYLAVAYATLYYSYFNSKRDPSFCAGAVKELFAILARNPDFKFGQIFSAAMFPNEKKQSPQVKIHELADNLIPLAVCYSISQKVADSIAGASNSSLEQMEMLCRLNPVESHPALLLIIHISLCTIYFYENDICTYNYHLEQALNIALPRKWYYPFAAYSYPNSWIEVKALDEEAYKDIRKLSNFVLNNYISNGFFKPNLTLNNPSSTRLRVAILVSRGMSNTQIASRLEITLYEVKKCIRELYENTGLTDRDELAEYVRFHLKIK